MIILGCEMGVLPFKETPIFSPNGGNFHGAESLDAITLNQIQVIEESLVDCNPRFHDETIPRKQVT